MILSRILFGTSRGVLLDWRENIRDDKKRQIACRLLVLARSRWFDGTMRGAVFDWRCKMRHEKDHQLGRNMLVRVFSVWLQGSMRGFLVEWRQNLKADTEKTKQKDAARRMARRMRNNTIGHAWTAWRTSAADRQRQLQLIQTAAARWVKGGLSKGLNKWRGEADRLHHIHELYTTIHGHI